MEILLESEEGNASRTAGVGAERMGEGERIPAGKQEVRMCWVESPLLRIDRRKTSQLNTK